MFLVDCPACSRTVGGGDVCECGYLYLDGGGRVYSRRGEGWENAPNIPVREEVTHDVTGFGGEPESITAPAYVPLADRISEERKTKKEED